MSGIKKPSETAVSEGNHLLSQSAVKTYLMRYLGLFLSLADLFKTQSQFKLSTTEFSKFCGFGLLILAASNAMMSKVPVGLPSLDR